MNGQSESAALPMILDGGPATGRILDTEPLLRSGRNWTRWCGPAISLLVLVAVGLEFRSLHWQTLRGLLPAGIGFWLLFLGYYLAGPASEFLIFRRLWSLPASGFAALLRKLVSNEILLGYLGEVHFYAWARRNAAVVASPFGAIKDVTILSALCGNLVTLAMILGVAPLLGRLHLGVDSRTLVVSIAFVLLSSLAALLLRRRLFTLPRRDLWWIAGLHLGRIFLTILLAAAMWHLILPGVAISWWVLLGTVRQLLSRLPLLPNKDVVFAGVASVLVGQGSAIVAAMALMATLILAAHLFVGVVLGAAELAAEGRRA